MYYYKPINKKYLRIANKARGPWWPEHKPEGLYTGWTSG